jgi:hypothetical protein
VGGLPWRVGRSGCRNNGAHERDSLQSCQKKAAREQSDHAREEQANLEGPVREQPAASGMTDDMAVLEDQLADLKLAINYLDKFLMSYQTCRVLTWCAVSTCHEGTVASNARGQRRAVGGDTTGSGSVSGVASGDVAVQVG